MTNTSVKLIFFTPRDKLPAKNYLWLALSLQVTFTLDRKSYQFTFISVKGIPDLIHHRVFDFPQHLAWAWAFTKQIDSQLKV